MPVGMTRTFFIPCFARTRATAFEGATTASDKEVRHEIVQVVRKHGMKCPDYRNLSSFRHRHSCHAHGEWGMDVYDIHAQLREFFSYQIIRQPDAISRIHRERYGGRRITVPFPYHT